MTSKIKIECTEKQKNQIIETINCGDDRSCSECPLKEKCVNYFYWHNRCCDVWEREIDWVIR